MGKEELRRRRSDRLFELIKGIQLTPDVNEGLKKILAFLRDENGYICPRVYRYSQKEKRYVLMNSLDLPEEYTQKVSFNVSNPIVSKLEEIVQAIAEKADGVADKTEEKISEMIYINENISSDLVDGDRDPLDFVIRKIKAERQDETRKIGLIGVPYIGFKSYEKQQMNGKKILRGAIVVNYIVDEKVIDEEEKNMLKLVGWLEGLNVIRQQLAIQVKLDGLTGLYSKKTFHEDLEGYLKEAKEKDRHYYLILMDCDRLKKLNDGFGHPTGDKFISALGEFLRSLNSIYRAGYRFGGDEFGVVVETDSAERVFSLAEKIRRGIQEIPVPEGYQPLTASLGIMKAGGELEDGERWYYEADEIALYEAKRRGGNKIISYEQGNKLYEIGFGKEGKLNKTRIK